jgi:hypothetical protein
MSPSSHPRTETDAVPETLPDDGRAQIPNNYGTAENYIFEELSHIF